MSIIFTDDFSSYTPGQDPFGNWQDLGFFKGQIVTLSNFDGQTKQGYNIGDGPIQFGGGTTAQLPQTTVMWSSLGDRNLGVVHQIGLSTDTSLGQIAYVNIEPDNTISLNVANQPFVNVSQVFANSPTQLFFSNTWQTWQVAWSLSDVAIITGTGTNTHTSHFIGVTASLWMDGTLLINGAFGTSGFPLSTSGFAIAAANKYFFGHPASIGGGAGYLNYIWATDSALATATFPFAPGTGAGGAVRDTQSVVEVSKKFPQNAARFTQGAVELTKMPPTGVRHARFTQGVVEIIKRGGSAQGWMVYEV